MFPFLQQPAYRQSTAEGFFADESCSVFEFGLLRDKDEGTTCREGFQEKPKLQTEDKEDSVEPWINQGFASGNRSG
jgi:hypothetical protein